MPVSTAGIEYQHAVLCSAADLIRRNYVLREASMVGAAHEVRKGRSGTAAVNQLGASVRQDVMFMDSPEIYAEPGLSGVIWDG